MTDLKKEITIAFESRNINFKKALRREFEKPASLNQTEIMSNYKNLLLFEIYKIVSEFEIAEQSEDLFRLIEETLFTYISEQK